MNTAADFYNAYQTARTLRLEAEAAVPQQVTKVARNVTIQTARLFAADEAKYRQLWLKAREDAR